MGLSRQNRLLTEKERKSVLQIRHHGSNWDIMDPSGCCVEGSVGRADEFAFLGLEA